MDNEDDVVSTSSLSIHLPIDIYTHTHTHTHTGILLSHQKNKSESDIVRWMNLEHVIQREVSQKEKNKYSILTHTHGI